MGSACGVRATSVSVGEVSSLHATANANSISTSSKLQAGALANAFLVDSNMLAIRYDRLVRFDCGDIRLMDNQSRLNALYSLLHLCQRCDFSGRSVFPYPIPGVLEFVFVDGCPFDH